MSEAVGASRVLCSTGALLGRPNGRDFHLLEPLSRQLDCDGFEFMMYSSWYDALEELLSYLPSLGLAMPVMHCEKHIGVDLSQGETGFDEARRKFLINCRIAHAIGAEKLVLHLWDGIVSDQHMENNLRGYGMLADVAEQQGVELLVENVVCNQRDPMTHMRELRSIYGQRVWFTFDTKMAAFHGQMKLLYQEENRWLWTEDRIRHIHVNDYAGAPMDWSCLKSLPMGSGQIDFSAFFAFVKGQGYRGDYTVEATAFGADGRVDVDMLNRCFAFIRGQIS